ncbi:hypothetical protein BD309DRAFT_994195 [Dichomitus squalens]|uniref:Uncharacterized protein n=1 Tax=Dichomitus squalens TaxID=114155 RepID=A0A4Q9NCX1_9APHY|nr:hypothetical protein BD309DRAFT_994195 [Dichomitus squalens]TBU63328.1 hypothetical protein BD310DRAFT_870119 [Dichomitus squalens]
MVEERVALLTGEGDGRLSTHRTLTSLFRSTNPTKGFRQLLRSFTDQLCRTATCLCGYRQRQPERQGYIPLKILRPDDIPSKILRLEDLPLEILHSIFLDACTDGGKTGCSLSLVSKGIHAASRAARFHSVSLLAPTLVNLYRFLMVYNDACSAAKNAGVGTPRVQHLCLLVDIFSGDGNSVPGVKHAGRDKRNQRHLGRLADLHDRENNAPRGTLAAHLRAVYHAGVVILLNMVAGDLTSLCLYRFPHDPMSPTVVPAFPKLQELWLGGEDTRSPFVFFRDRDDSGPRFPQLRRLHTRVDGHASIWRWCEDAPRLRDVRIVADAKMLLQPEDCSKILNIAANPWWEVPGRQVKILVRSEKTWRTRLPLSRAVLLMVLRGMLVERSRSLVFVPFYTSQDLDSGERESIENQSRFWGGDRQTGPDELFRRDWLACMAPLQDGRRDGIYVRDFWTRAPEPERRSRIGAAFGKVGSRTKPDYMTPLVIPQT